MPADITSELRERRSGLYTRWKTLRGEIKAIETDLKAIDRVLAMVSPSMVMATAPRGSSAAAGGCGLWGAGELTPEIMEALTTLGRPATSADVAEVMLASKGLLPSDARLPGLASRVSAILGAKAEKGLVTRRGMAENGKAALWEAVVA